MTLGALPLVLGWQEEFRLEVARGTEGGMSGVLGRMVRNGKRCRELGKLAGKCI